MCIFSTLIIWELHFKVHTSFEAQNFMLLLSLSLHSSSPTFKFLSTASYGGELLLDSSSPWSGVSNHLSSFSIPLPFIIKKQRNPLMKKTYCRKMGAYAKDEKLLIHSLQESLTGVAVIWYTSLEPPRVHSWKELMVAFVRQGQYNGFEQDATIEHVQKGGTNLSKNMPKGGGIWQPKCFPQWRRKK